MGEGGLSSHRKLSNHFIKLSLEKYLSAAGMIVDESSLSTQYPEPVDNCISCITIISFADIIYNASYNNMLTVSYGLILSVNVFVITSQTTDNIITYRKKDQK